MVRDDETPRSQWRTIRQLCIGLLFCDSQPFLVGFLGHHQDMLDLYTQIMVYRRQDLVRQITVMSRRCELPCFHIGEI
jgi:hypothetical protein